MVKLKFLIILLTWSSTAAEVPDRYFIESFLSDSATNLVNKEAFVAKKLSNFCSLLKICSSNLKASNVSANFTSLLDKYAAKIWEVQSLKDLNFINIPIVNLSLYDYSQFRIATIFSDIKNLKVIKENLRDNSTILYKLSNQVRIQYLNNYFTMVKLRSKNKLVNTVIKEIIQFFSRQTSYVQLLTIHIGNYEKLRTYLSNLIISKAVPTPANLTLDPLMTSIRSVESKLVPAQQQIITMAKIASRKIKDAQRTVASSRKVQGSDDISNIFNKMQNFFEETASMNDYSLLGWPRFPDVSGDSSTVRLRAKMTEDKNRNFGISEKMILKQKEETKTLQNELNAATMIFKSSGKKVQALSPAIISVLNATKNLENSQTNYVLKLNAARTQMAVLQRGLFTTTTNVPTTTTKYVQPACGTFLPFNPNTDLTLVATYGLSAGNNLDGNPIFVGKGDNSAYLGLKSCPARISIDPAKPGAFMSSGTAENFDNTNASFLASHPSIIWGLVSESTAWNYHYGIRMMSGEYPVMLARVNISGVTYVGRFHYGNGLVGMYYYRSDLNQVVKLEPTQNFEVLGCVVDTSTGCFGNIVYDLFTNITHPFDNGITAGFHIDGSFAYPGHTRSIQCPMISTNILHTVSRVSSNPKNPGSFVVCYNTTHSYEIQANYSLSFYPKTKLMTWKKATITNVRQILGFCEYGDEFNSVVIGRYQMSNWTMIGKVVILGTSMGFYGWNPETQSVLKLPATTEFEILAAI